MKTACLMMQRNEHLLLTPWVLYHGRLFGFNNLFIFDNGSDDELTKAKLRELSDKYGVFVDYSKSSRSNFEQKGEIIVEKIRALEASDNYDFFVPLDCDEFVCVSEQNQIPSFIVEDILSAIKVHAKSKNALIIEGCYYNVYGRKDYFYYLNVKKTFFANGAAGYLDVGFHDGKSRASDSSDSTTLRLMHLHNKPFDVVKAHAAQKLQSRVPNMNEETLRSYVGMGAHLIKYFFMTEREYVDSFPKSSAMHIPQFALVLEEIGSQLPY